MEKFLNGYDERTLVTPVTIFVGILTAIVGILSVITGPENAEEMNGKLLLFYALVTYLILSYRFWDSVQEDETAALFFFGKPLAKLKSGPFFAPLGFFQKRSVTRLVRQREFPAEPEMIYRGDLKSRDGLPEGMKPPIRIPFRDSITKEEAEVVFIDDFTIESPEGKPVSFVADVPDDGLGQRVTAEPVAIVRLRVDDPIAFFQNIGSINEAFRQIEDEVTSVISNYFPRMSLAQALVNLKWIGYILFQRVEIRTGARSPKQSGEGAEVANDVKCWGVSIQSVTIKVIELDHGINSAISRASQANFLKTETIKAAEGEKIKLIREGEGAARAARDLEQKTLEGRGKGVEAYAKKTGISADSVQAAEVTREVGSAESNTVVVGADGMTQLVGMAAAVTKVGKQITEDSDSLATADEKSEEAKESPISEDEGDRS